MQSEKNLSQQSSVSQLDTYTGIDDLVMRVWWKIQDTGDVTLLIKEKFKITEEVVEGCSDLWDDIRQQHKDAFGWPADYDRYLNLKADIAIKELEYAINQDGWVFFTLGLDKDELEEIENRPKQTNLRAKAIIETGLPNIGHIDIDKVVVEEFYNYIKLLEERSHGN